MQSDEGIEDEQPRLHPGDCLVETDAIGIEIEPQAGSGDDLDVEIGEVESGGGADAVEAAPDDVQGVLGG